MSATTVTAAGVDPAPGQGEAHPSGEVIMRARGLEMSFGRTHALRGVDLDLLAGEVLAVTGPSGIWCEMILPNQATAASIQSMGYCPTVKVAKNMMNSIRIKIGKPRYLFVMT